MSFPEAGCLENLCSTEQSSEQPAVVDPASIKGDGLAGPQASLPTIRGCTN